MFKTAVYKDSGDCHVVVPPPRNDGKPNEITTPLCYAQSPERLVMTCKGLGIVQYSTVYTNKNVIARLLVSYVCKAKAVAISSMIINSQL